MTNITQNQKPTHALFAPLQDSQAYNRLLSGLNTFEKGLAKPTTQWATEVVESQKWHLTAALLKATNRPALIIAPSELKAKAIYEDLLYFFRDACCLYPSRDMLFYAADVKSVDITRQRLRVLDKITTYTRAVSATRQNPTTQPIPQNSPTSPQSPHQSPPPIIIHQPRQCWTA